MTRQFPQTAVFILALVWLTACAAETQWSKSGSNASQMLRDRSQCRSWASTEAEKEYQLDRETLRYSPSDSGNNHRARMMAFSAKKRLKQLIEQCMQQNGYQKIRRQ